MVYDQILNSSYMCIFLSSYWLKIGFSLGLDLGPYGNIYIFELKCEVEWTCFKFQLFCWFYNCSNMYYIKFLI